jgi:hypothetical protein
MVKHFLDKVKADKRRNDQRLWAKASSAPRSRKAKAADVTAEEKSAPSSSSD